MPLSEVCADLKLEGHTVLRALSAKASISVEILIHVLRMRENGKSFERISELCDVPLASLLEILSDQTSEAAIPPRSHETKRWPNGDSYQGQLLNDKPHGHGTMNYFEDGRTYVGSWVNGTRQGRGEVTWPSGSRFEGEIKNDMKNGQGKHRSADGSVYSGLFQDNKMHGHGVYTWPSGHRYEGQWENGKRHGHGVEVEPDGGRYSGTWSEDEKHGEFSYSKGGTSRRERWTAGVFTSILRKDKGCTVY
jgi:hypothetical protein